MDKIDYIETIKLRTFKEAFKRALGEEECLFEYAKVEPWMMANSVSAKTHGKSIMRGDRKHQNLKRKEYQLNNPIVDAVRKTKGDRVASGKVLEQLLDQYQMSFVDGVIKGIGRSIVGIAMWVDPKSGEKMGIVHIKNPNRVFPQLNK